jgi:hypothetical protein
VTKPLRPEAKKKKAEKVLLLSCGLTDLELSGAATVPSRRSRMLPLNASARTSC